MRRLTESPPPVGGSATQLARFSSSPTRIGSASIGGSTVFALSPQLCEKGTSMSKNSSEIDPSPSTCHGDVPSSWPRMRTLYTPTPNTLTDIDEE
ncbi:MAG: hypothetical protein WDN44_07445 [Sphingomonas sp.]